MGRINNKGFTLLELMISITIFSIILLIIFGAVRIGHRSIEKSERTIELLERVRTGISIMEAQLQSQIPLSYEENGERKLFFLGQKDSIQFATNFSAWSGQRGYVKVVYNIEPEADGTKALYITENTISIDDSKKTMLLKDLEEISFHFFYKEPQNLDGEWRDEWTETNFLPEKVAVNIIDRKRKFSLNLLVDIKNQSLTTTTAPIMDEPRRDFPKQGRPVQY